MENNKLLENVLKKRATLLSRADSANFIVHANNGNVLISGSPSQSPLDSG